MIYIKPSWRNNITGLLLLVGGLGWLNFPSFLMELTSTPIVRIIIGITIVIYSLYLFRGKL